MLSYFDGVGGKDQGQLGGRGGARQKPGEDNKPFNFFVLY